MAQIPTPDGVHAAARHAATITNLLVKRGAENKELMKQKKNALSVIEKHMDDYQLTKLHGLAGAWVAEKKPKTVEPEFDGEFVRNALLAFQEATRQSVPVDVLTMWILSYKKLNSKTEVSFSFGKADAQTILDYEKQSALQIQQAIASNQPIGQPLEHLFPTEMAKQLRSAQAQAQAQGAGAGGGAGGGAGAGRTTRAGARRGAGGNGDPVPM